MIQLALVLCVMFGLWFKRVREPPAERRVLSVWGLDVSKQALSAGAAHVCGILSSMMLQSSGRCASGTSACGWYFVVYACVARLPAAPPFALTPSRRAPRLARAPPRCSLGSDGRCA